MGQPVQGGEAGGAAVGTASLLGRIQQQGLLEALARHIEQKAAEPAFRRDLPFLRRLLPWMELFGRYFDAQVSGFENLPPRGGVLLVGNHSGGVLVPDVPVLFAAWYRELGFERPLLGLALDAMFAIPGLEQLMRGIGEIPANHRNAERALAEGAAVLVYPGGGREAFRPWRLRNRIDFGGHKGFVRLALRTGVPVVPVVGHGAHETLVVLARGDRLARRLGLDRLRLPAVPLVWGLPWGVSPALPPSIPLPAQIRVELLPSLDWSQHGPEAARDEALVDRCYREITERMQAALTRMARQKPFPLLSRLCRLL